MGDKQAFPQSSRRICRYGQTIRSTNIIILVIGWLEVWGPCPSQCLNDKLLRDFEGPS